MGLATDPLEATRASRADSELSGTARQRRPRKRRHI